MYGDVNHDDALLLLEDDDDEQEDQTLQVTHPVHVIDCEMIPAHSVKSTLAVRKKIVQLLNDVSLMAVQEALRLLYMNEAGSMAPNTIEIVVGQRVEPCSRTNRACTNGKTIWVSLSMFQGDNAPTEAEVGFPIPAGVNPGTIVILHEFAHLLMGHPYNKATSKEVKERRADSWVKKFVEGLDDNI